ncbi:hypothetical protein ANN_00024 [Periplaneta americana]|uniref:DUF4817 domain-containing protein n=1 Tax=Periplaneta americana TaxID=6978 RepID=A0ABQ8TPX8_PERAM|nr:hypothetical protein ANN_00024 [Periplaneta americana]
MKSNAKSYPAIFYFKWLRENPEENQPDFTIETEDGKEDNIERKRKRKQLKEVKSKATQRAYQREFGVRNPPKRNTILGLVNKLETTGSLVSEKGKHRSSRLPTVVVDVRARLQQSPKKSLRRLSLSLLSNWTMNLWPPRSPDLITPDFFLWGYLKDRVYATRPQTLDDLKHNITQEIQAIDNRVLQRVASNMERRVELCLMQDGGHFQHLL